jgi:hypothetical protein
MDVVELVRKDVFLLVCMPQPEADLFALPYYLVLYRISYVMCHWQPFNSPSMIATRDIRDIEGGHITSPLPTKCIICTRRLTPFLCCCTCTFALCILLVDSR